LVQTIREVLAGHKHISPAVAKRLAEHTPRMALTDRELQVLNQSWLALCSYAEAYAALTTSFESGFVGLSGL
jgi:hypothetical protein